MKLAQKLAIVGIGGLVLGAGAIEMLHAQGAAPPAYLVADVKVTDPDVFKNYIAKLPATLAPFGGQTLARNGTLDVLEGDRPAGGLVIIRFDSLAKARAFWNSPAYQEIVPIRQKSAQSRIVVVEGLAP
jgi:uncharacterized protein (DUF1330 family)